MKNLIVVAVMVIFGAAVRAVWAEAPATQPASAATQPATDDINADGKPGSSPVSANLVAAGEWSKSVSDSHGSTLRGRILVYKGANITVSGEPWQFAAGVYLEIQDMAEKDKAPTQIYFDVDKTLQFELRDANGAAARASLPGGPNANSPMNVAGYWATVPAGGVLRVYANYGLAGSTSLLGGSGSLPLLFHFGGQWIISANDPNAYYLSVTIPSPPADSIPLKTNFWQGSLELPAVKLTTVEH